MYRNKEWLKNEFLINKKSARDIATECGVGENTIFRYVKKYNIVKEVPKYKNKEWLNCNIQIKTDLEIALECDTSEATIARWRKRLQLEKHKPKYQDREWLIAEIKKYGTTKKVADAHSFNCYTINDWCLKFGISRGDREKLRSGNLEEDYFTIIDEEHKAYWLGFLMADGSMRKGLNNFSINLKAEDGNHLELLKSDIGSDAIITDKTGGFGTPCKDIVICNRKMCIDLNYHGIVPKKTGKECLPSTVPNDMIRHFIRGFLDGDGNIFTGVNYKSNISVDFAGMSYNIFYSIHEYFESERLISSDIKISKEKNTNCIHLRYYSSNAITILDHIYKNSTIHLERKHSKYLNKK